MTFFTYFKVIYQPLIHIQDKGALAYQVEESHIHIVHVSNKGHKSTKTWHTHALAYHILCIIKEEHKVNETSLQVTLHTYYSWSI